LNVSLCNGTGLVRILVVVAHNNFWVRHHRPVPIPTVWGVVPLWGPFRLMVSA
jgi:hypothetical protein